MAACKRKGVRVAGKNLAGEAQGGQEVGWPAIATSPLLHSSPQRRPTLTKARHPARTLVFLKL